MEKTLIYTYIKAMFNLYAAKSRLNSRGAIWLSWKLFGTHGDWRSGMSNPEVEIEKLAGTSIQTNEINTLR